MTTPVLVITGYLGAGKTTLVNSMLTRANGLRIAAVVNDFGAINIDEELVGSRSDGVVGLANGCICCTLQGDLLRTLKLLLTGARPPDHIVIEASGVADPSGIVQALSDPVLWKSIRLDAVACVIDAQDVTETPARRTDDLWRAQLGAANIIVLTKTATIAPDEVSALEHYVSSTSNALVFAADRAAPPLELLLGSNVPPPSGFLATDAAAAIHSDRFAKVEWQSESPISLQRLQILISNHSPGLMRAKGVFSFHEMPGTSYLLQLVGQRVTLEPLAGVPAPGCRVVMIGETGHLKKDLLLGDLNALGDHASSR